jgi:hydrogenase expression/formation protein HypC
MEITMCLAIPAKVTAIRETIAEVEIEGTTTTADISVLDDVKVGDYVMVHAGLAIQKYEEEEALADLALLRELFQKMKADE